MLAFLRRNTVAFIALFIALGGTAYAANTVRSADIVDGQVMTADLASKAVTPAKATNMWTFQKTMGIFTQDCTKSAQTWTACAPVKLTVPAGHQYTVNVASSVSANPGATAKSMYWCPAKQGPTCLSGVQEALTLAPNEWRNAHLSVSFSVPAGTYTFSTAVWVSGAITSDASGHTYTTVIATDTQNTTPH